MLLNEDIQCDWQYVCCKLICFLCRNINEDKRKAEGHQVMFEIVNDIENCPVCDLQSNLDISKLPGLPSIVRNIRGSI